SYEFNVAITHGISSQLSSTSLFLFLFFYTYVRHRELHSFPTRRSSDLDTLHGNVSTMTQVNPLGDGRDATATYTWDMKWDFVSRDRKSTRLNSSHLGISYAVFCLKKKKKKLTPYVVFMCAISSVN